MGETSASCCADWKAASPSSVFVTRILTAARESMAAGCTHCRVDAAITQRVREIVDLRILIARRQRSEVEAPLDQLQDRDGFIFGMVDAALLSKWGDDDCGNAHANSPAVTAHGGTT